MRAAADPLLDEQGHAWALDYVAAVGVGLSREKAEGILRATRSVGRRLKSLRLAYLGELLLRLEARGLTPEQARALAPWIARGAPQPRPMLEPLSIAARRGAIAKRRELAAELRSAGYNPPPEPPTPTQRDREAVVAGERERHRVASECRARFERRLELSRVPIFVAGFDESTVRVLVLAILNGLPIRHERELAEELAVALGRLRQLDPCDEVPFAAADLVAQTDGAHRAAEAVLGEPVQPMPVDERLVPDLVLADDAHEILAA